MNNASINEEIKKIMNTRDDIAKKFWSLLQYCWEKFKGDNVPRVVNLWYNAGCITEKMKPHFNIITTGPFLYKFKEEISNNQLDWIMNLDFDSQLDDWREMLNRVSSTLCNGLDETLVTIKEYLQLRIQSLDTEQGRVAGLNVCKTLLAWYSRYSMLEKNIEELELEIKLLLTS